MNEHPSSGEDAALVARVLAGDTAAFAGLVHRWQSPLVNLAWRFCRDRGRAEEMAQEAFLRAFRNLAQWRGDAAFSTWLFALAANVYRTELRRIPATMLSLDEIAEPPDQRLSAAAAFDDASRDEALRRAVLALPPKYRDAVLLFYFHDQDVPAAARTLRVPEGTIKARLFRGRELLRSKFSRSHARMEAATAEPASLAAARPKEVQ
ncbi:MAG TPA: sigma-70 family RNA polymerase sigma factor [Acidobacteriaceae bacterium]|nr:sigma-70 family RNA polymerase sigma factor [Acidobacteriaceae bacterium]